MTKKQHAVSAPTVPDKGPQISDEWIAARWPNEDAAEVRRRFNALMDKLGETPWRGMPRFPEVMQPVLAWAAMLPTERIEALTAALADVPEHFRDYLYVASRPAFGEQSVKYQSVAGDDGHGMGRQAIAVAPYVKGYNIAPWIAAASPGNVGALLAELGRLQRATAPNEGAFRMGARAMRDAIEARGKHLLEKREAAKRKSGNDYIEAALQFAIETSIPDFPAPPPSEQGKWAWWAGRNEEWFTVGPEDSRSDVVEIAQGEFDGEPFYIIEAQRGALTLNAERLLNEQYFEADDLFDFEHSEPDRCGGADQIAAADAELQALLDGWCDRWRHTFTTPTLFAASRNREHIAVESTTVAEQPE